MKMAKDIWSDESNATDEKAKFESELIFPIGEPNTAYAKYFSGNSYRYPFQKKSD